MKETDDLVEQVLQMAFMNQYMYARVSFDNAKDTNTLLTIANENANMMLTAAKSRLIPFTEELLERKIQSLLKDSNRSFKLRHPDGRMIVVKFEIEQP